MKQGFWPIVQHSYCNACSMIGYWHDTVFRPSVRLSVTKCLVALTVGVGVESCKAGLLAYSLVQTIIAE